MDNLKFEFSATSGYLYGKTIANVKVYHDRIVIDRDTKRANIPREMTILFEDVVSITYDENKSNAWIGFAVDANLPNSQLKYPQLVQSIRPGEIAIMPNVKVAPFDEPYAIVFPKNQKDDARAYYERLLVLSQSVQQHRKEVYTVDQESPLDKLKKLKELLDMGVLSETEYEQKKNELLQLI